MLRQLIFASFLICAIGFAASCSTTPSRPTQTSPTTAASLPNPASVFCENNGGKLEFRQDQTGGVAGICVFADRSECDEWAYFRGECKPGSSGKTAEPTFAPTSIPTPNVNPEFASDGWRVYRNETLGYSLHYPPDATIENADDPQRTLTITGPLIGNDHWPVIFLSHPNDREDYRPPSGVDLEKWLTEHNLLTTGGKHGEVIRPAAPIAGGMSIHTRLERSPQTFAYDKYFFAHDQQLYVVVILHSGDKEDWTLYNHFLASIRFD